MSNVCLKVICLVLLQLTELRDLIKCPSDLVIAGEMSNNPKLTPKEASKMQKAKEMYRSGFIYVEGTFYNDMRWPECVDYSETIRNWVEKTPEKRGIGPFKTAKMEETKIEDLTVKMGYPYVYVHQGEHEHLVSFVDARLMGVDDVQAPSAYPFERSVSSKQSTYCTACSVNIATWITTDNDRVPENPFFFCDECFHSFNYTLEGHKIGDFKAYPYVDANAL